MKKDDGSVKFVIYRKPTHTDHAVLSLTTLSHQKMEVIRTLFDGKDRIITEDDDKQIATGGEESCPSSDFSSTLKLAAIPSVVFQQILTSNEALKKQNATKEGDGSNKCRGMVVVSYTRGE